MVQYRRDFTPGATYFFTLTLKNRHLSHLTDHIDALGDAFRSIRHLAPFTTHAIVILPNHLHAILELPRGDDNYSSRWRLIKTHFTRSLLARNVLLRKNGRNEYDLWQRRFWEHRIRDEYDLTTHIHYIHFNPVKHGLVERPRDWPHSSVHRYIKKRILPLNWGEKDVSSPGVGENGILMGAGLISASE